MATLISVNVGTPRDVAWNNRTVYTGAWKQPVAGPRMVRRLNVDGDGQGDLGGHGGENRAVLVYQIESYRHWASEFNRDDLLPGYARGELHRRRIARRRGLHRGPIPDRRGDVRGHPAEGHLLPGRYAHRGAPDGGTAGIAPASGVLLPRHRRGRGGGRSGDRQDSVWAGTGDGRRDRRPALPPGHARDGLERALRIPALSPGWKASLQSLADQNGGAATSSGNTGLTAAASSPPPSWPGFRPLRVTAVHDESRAVRSVSLADLDGVTLPEWLPGQSITLRLHPESSEAALIRNYSLSNRPGSDGYRISVKREPHGAASGYIHAHVKVGDLIDVAAPRGTFFLTDSEAPVILLSAGVGATPVLSMLHALVKAGSTREVWWLHGARNGDEHPFAAESRALLDRLPNSRSRVYYSRPGSADRQGVDFTAEGRLSIGGTRPAVRRGGLPVWPGFLHERSQCRARDLRPGVRAHPHGNIRRHSSTHTRYRRDVGAAAPAAGTTRPGARGPVRAQRHLGAVGTAIREPARVRRSMRRSDSMVLPDRGLSQLRNCTARRGCPLRPAAAGTSRAGKHPDLLRATHRGGGRRPLSAAPG